MWRLWQRISCPVPGTRNRDHKGKSTSRRRHAVIAAWNCDLESLLRFFTVITGYFTAKNATNAYASEMAYFVHKRRKHGEPPPLDVCLHTQKLKQKPYGKDNGDQSCSGMTDQGVNSKYKTKQVTNVPVDVRCAQTIHWLSQFTNTHADPYRWMSLQIWGVWGNSSICQVISKHTWWSTQVTVPTDVRCVGKSSIGQMFCKHTWGSTQVKDPTDVRCVGNSSIGQLVSKDTWESTQVNVPTDVKCVGNSSIRLAISKYTWGSTQANVVTDVTCVKNNLIS